MSYLVKWQVHSYWDCVSICYGYKLVSIVRKDYSPSLHSRDGMEKKIVSRFPVLEAGSMCWKHLGQVTKMEESPPGSHLRKDFVQFGYFDIYVCGKKTRRKDGKVGNTLYQLNLELGSTWCMTRKVFHTASLFRWNSFTPGNWVTDGLDGMRCHSFSSYKYFW